MKSLRLKFITYILPVIIILSLSFLAFFIHHSDTLLEQKLIEFGFYSAEGLSYSCELGVHSEDVTFLLDPIRGVFEEEDVIAVAIYGRDGHIIVSRKKEEQLEEGIPQDVVEEISTGRRALMRIDYTKQGKKIYNFFSPIFASGILSPADKEGQKKIIGFTKVGLSLGRIEKETREMLYIGLAMVLLMIFVGGGLVIFLVDKMTNPIVKLTKGAETIGKGNLDYRIKVRTGDEIEELADSFNEMTKNLKKSDVALKEKIKELEEYIDVTSHDLQQPLATIQAYTMFLKSSKIDSESLKNIKTIEYQASFMRNLLNDLLSYSRTKKKMPFKEVKTKEILKEVVETLSTQIERSNAKIKVKDIPDKIIGQEKRITQLFRNLLNNALEHTDKKPIIEVGCREREKDYLFWVKDNGIGIDKKYHKKIFKPFWKLGKGPGTGMGLTICKTIVKNHGGDIWVDSELGKGSTFYFTIPKRRRFSRGEALKF